MVLPTCLQQQSWVLQSASADRVDHLKTDPNEIAWKAWQLLKPGLLAFEANDREQAKQLWSNALKTNPSNLPLQRTLNKYAPELLKINDLRLSPRELLNGYNIAVVIPGELRCLDQSRDFFKALSKHTDLFLCTDKRFEEEAHSIPSHRLILAKNITLAYGSMHQWHKLNKALEMVRLKEIERGRRYTHIIKLRTDFHHSQPHKLLKEIVQADGILCASDKVFGGRRELMLLFQGFYSAIRSIFDQKEQTYWRMNVKTILQSDDSTKWYGFAFPKSLVGEPNSVDELRQVLYDGGDAMADALLAWPTTIIHSDEHYIKFFKGHQHFASEICFARFLNLNAITSHSSPGLSGFLRSDRFS